VTDTHPKTAVSEQSGALRGGILAGIFTKISQSRRRRIAVVIALGAVGNMMLDDNPQSATSPADVNPVALATDQQMQQLFNDLDAVPGARSIAENLAARIEDPLTIPAPEPLVVPTDSSFADVGHRTAYDDSQESLSAARADTSLRSADAAPRTRAARGVIRFTGRIIPIH